MFVRSEVLLSIFVGTALGSAALWAPSSFAGDISLHLQESAEARLDQTVTLNGKLHSGGKFSGTIDLSADTSALSKASSDISFRITPAVATVTSGTVADIPFKVTITTTASSHSFQGIPVQVSAKTSDGSAPLNQTLLVTVDPIYEIDLTGGPAPEGWSSPMTLTMPKHEPAVTIRFVNLDTQSTHTIHGDGAIPHQDPDTPLAVATPGHPGGVYEVTVPAGDPVMGYYRCHDHEDDSMLRSISFNN